jgi:hypothetical protein
MIGQSCQELQPLHTIASLSDHRNAPVLSPRQGKGPTTLEWPYSNYVFNINSGEDGMLEEPGKMERSRTH